MYSKCYLHLFRHLLQRKDLTAEAEAIVSEDDDGDEVADGQQLFVLDREDAFLMWRNVPKLQA